MTVHPRLRGELSFGPCTDSSVRRFIPACAGNSRCRLRQPMCRAVHPRLRGELSVQTVKQHEDTRFIPACAGNSNKFREQAKTAAVHPRLRGELRATEVCGEASSGSSPLARGTRSGGPRSFSGRRFIPACAGNSFAGHR